MFDRLRSNIFSSGRQADAGIKRECTCFHLPWQRLDVLALCVSVFQPLLQRKHYYSIFELPSVDTSVKIDSGGAAWNGLKCSADGRRLYLDKAQSKKGLGTF